MLGPHRGTSWVSLLLRCCCYFLTERVRLLGASSLVEISSYRTVSLRDNGAIYAGHTNLKHTIITDPCPLVGLGQHYG